ncbi:MAG TPA: hypothetical protein DIU07_01520 [Rhodobacteraceae bacterium]|nr:hypothetical protein [Paracoccaceae bacterium]
MARQRIFRHVARLCAAFALAAAGAAAADPALLFDWQTERCDRWDIPDAPARFWRDASGQVHMLAGNEANRESVGPDLRHLEHVCRLVHAGAEDPDPAARNDRVWIVSVFTRDGVRIEALGHAEYHGHRHGRACAADDYMSCWRNAIVALESDDGGRSFTRVPGPPVAALPYRYDRDQSRRSGYFNPSNMIVAGDHLYFYFFAEAYGVQRRGVCLARRKLDGGPADWRGWDGQDFSIRFADPYAPGLTEPERHVCTPLPGLTAPLNSIVRQPATGRYLAVSPMVAEIDGTRTVGFWAFTSTDLIHWRDRVLLAPMPLLWARDCADSYAHAYASLVDPDSGSRTFETVGTRFWLTLVRMSLDAKCRVGPERDLIRFDVSWPAQADAPPTVRAPRADR